MVDEILLIGAATWSAARGQDPWVVGLAVPIT